MWNRRVFFIFLMIPVVLFFSGTDSYAENVVIIANKNVPIDSLSRKDIEKIFLGRKKCGTISLKFILSSREIRHQFLAKYVKRAAFQYQNYWRKQLFTGKGKIPRSLDSDKIIEFVMKNDGYISYLSSETKIEGVKKITVY